MALQIGLLYTTYTLVKELRRTNEDMNSQREEFAKLLEKTENKLRLCKELLESEAVFNSNTSS